MERDNQRKEVQLKNNLTFIKTLEESLDENYESFSPRKVDEKNHMKIESLLREQREIEESIRKIKVQIIDLNVQISELDNVIKIARNNEKLVLTSHMKLS